MKLVSFGGINNSSRFEGMGDGDSGRAVALSDDPMDNSIDVDGTVGPSESVFEKKDGILDLEAPVKEDSSTAAVISMKDEPLEAVDVLSVLPRTNGVVEVKANEDRPDGATATKKDENFKAASGNSTLLGRSNDTSEAVTNEVFQVADGAAILKKDEPLEASSNSSIVAIENNEKASGRKVGNGPANVGPQKLTVPRSSNYHGVTRHRWSGKFEAHLWDSSCRMEGRRRKGKQVYLGSYDSEEKAARAYDVAALKFWGASTKLNFPVSDYEKELEDIKNMTRVECINYLRRRSSCFARGASIYRGVTRRQKDGRWQARIGRVAGTKDIYLGTFKTEEEAAEAYDMACVELRGANAVTNFDISNYCEKGVQQLEGEDLKQI